MNSTLNHLDDTQLVKILLHSPLATGVYTTENIIIHFANDAMIEFWGKDRSVIGKPMIEAIPELEGQPFVDILKNVWRTGITYQGMSTPAELTVNNRTRKFYFDFVYKALKNDAGQVYAILHTAVDVTERNLDQQKVKESELALTHEQAMNDELASSNEELFATIEELHATQEELSTLNNELEDRVSDRTKVSAASEARIRFILNDAPVAIIILTGREMIVEAANKKTLEVWGKTEEVIGKPLQVVLPELVGQDFLQLLDEVYTAGKPYYGNEVKALFEKNGVLEEVYSNFIFQPIGDINGIISGIIVTANIVTEQVLARKLLENSEKEQQAINEELSATIKELATANEDQIIINEELSHTQDKLQEMISNLAHSEKRSLFMLNAIPQQVWTSDPQGALDYVNQVVCNDFGYTTDDIVGHGWKKFIHPDDLDRCLKKWNLALETGLEYLIEFRLLFRDGTYRWYLSRALPFIEEGKVRLWLGTNTNIEIQKENEMKKDEFLSIASHELKTPLTSIKAFNQLLLRVKDPFLMESFAEKSSEHIIRLERLISDLLDVTKINAGKLQYYMEPFNFGKMLLNSVQVLRHTSTDHEIILQSIADINYTGDQFRLELVINNFISNAVKYSPEGEKVIVNSKIEMDNIVVSVQDFGIGIAGENLDKLFDRYYRVDNTAMRFEGLGLGLFISSEILKRHHGSFWIESLLGKGSTFYFKLPLFPDIKNDH